MTNREWLSTLSDEQLAERIVRDNCCESCFNYNGLQCCGSYPYADCMEGILKWLKQDIQNAKQDIR